jgi:MFS family permease
MSEGPAIKITAEDLAKVGTSAMASQPIPAPATQEPGGKRYGNIHSQIETATGEEQKERNVFLEAWFYLGAAGLVGAVIGWAICEPAFFDAPTAHSWGNTWILPSIITFMCLAFGLAESISEHSWRKALYRAGMALPLGFLLGFFFDFMANIFYGVMINIGVSLGAHSFHNPILWIGRGLAWVVFGVAGGAVYGIIGMSSKKAQYGILGGMLGAGIGGVVFDPIAMGLHRPSVSRVVGFMLFGLFTGCAMGIVENALKDRWIFVSAGPLAGKQFILYKPRTTLGSVQSCDVYLFKDQSILPEHAVFEAKGNRMQLTARGQVFVSGQPVRARVLQSGDSVQIGRYSFQYREKLRS